MILEGLAVAFVMFLGTLSDTGLGDPMLRRPLVVSTLVGLLLGDLKTGVTIGATLEVIFLGITQVGGTLPSDSMTGSIFGTAFAILTKQGAEVALTLALPISMLAVFINQIILFLRGTLIDRFTSYIDNGEFSKFERLHLTSTIGTAFIYSIIGFVGIVLGADAIEGIVANIPEVVMNGLNLAGKILPALGLSLLLNTLWDNKLAVFLLLGYVLNAYLNLPLIAIASIGLVIAVYSGLVDSQILSTSRKSASVNEFSTKENEEDDFFGE